MGGSFGGMMYRIARQNSPALQSKSCQTDQPLPRQFPKMWEKLRKFDQELIAIQTAHTEKQHQAFTHFKSVMRHSGLERKYGRLTLRQILKKAFCED